MLVHAMKAKQTTDQAHVEKLRELVVQFSKLYFNDDDLKHIRSHHPQLGVALIEVGHGNVGEGLGHQSLHPLGKIRNERGTTGTPDSPLSRPVFAQPRSTPDRPSPLSRLARRPGGLH